MDVEAARGTPAADERSERQGELAKDGLDRPAAEEAERKIGEALLELARLCCACHVFDGVCLAEVERASTELVRSIALCRAELVNAVESGAGSLANAVRDWAVSAKEAAHTALDKVDVFTAAPVVARCVRAAYYRRQLGSARVLLQVCQVALRDMLLSMGELGREAAEQLAAVQRLVAAQFSSHERQRSMRVRDHKEQCWHSTVQSLLDRLHGQVLQRGKLIRDAHLWQQKRCRQVFYRMGALGVDQVEDRPGRAIRLEPLAHSPRLADRHAAKLSRSLQAAVHRYETMPGSPSFSFSHFSTSAAPIKPTVQPTESELPEADRFDQFFAAEAAANDATQLITMKELAAVCCETPEQLARHLCSLGEQQLGFSPTRLPEIVRSPPAEAQSSVRAAWVCLRGTPDKHAIQMGCARSSSQATDDAQVGQVSNAAARESTSDEAEARDWQNLLRQICDQLEIIRFSRLLNATRGMKVVDSTSDVRRGDCILVEASAELAKASIRSLVSSRNASGLVALLSLHAFNAETAADTCNGLLAVVTADDYLGSCDAARLAFVRDGGVGLLLSIVVAHSTAGGEGSSAPACVPPCVTAALQVLAAVAKSDSAAVLGMLMRQRATHICLWAVPRLVCDPVALCAACTILWCVSRAEPGRALLGQLGAAAVFAGSMLKCPVKRTFHEAHLAACSAMASMMAGHAGNAAQVAQIADNAGVVYLCDVVTRVPGNQRVYLMACTALGRLAEHEPACLFNQEARGLSTVLQAMGRFPLDEAIQCQCLVALAHTAQNCPTRIADLLQMNVLAKICSAMEAFQATAESQVTWRSFLFLAELLRRRKRCTEHIWRAFEQDSVWARVADTALATVGADEANFQTMTWAMVFLRVAVLACTPSYPVEPTLPLFGALTAEEDDGDDDEEGGGGGGGGGSGVGEDANENIVDGSLAAALAGQPTERKPQVEPAVRQKGESLSAFLRRQAAIDAQLREEERKREEALEEARLPPLELREAWRTTLNSLLELRMPSIAVRVAAKAADDPVAAREAMRAFVTWLQVDERLFPQVAAPLCEAAGLVLHHCRRDVAALVFACEVLHIITERLAAELRLGDARRVRRGLGPTRPVQDLSVEREMGGFGLDSAFAGVFEELERAKRAPTPPRHLVQEWAKDAVARLLSAHVLEHIETAKMCHTGSCAEVVSSLSCLKDTVQDLTLLVHN